MAWTLRSFSHASLERIVRDVKTMKGSSVSVVCGSSVWKILTDERSTNFLKQFLEVPRRTLHKWAESSESDTVRDGALRRASVADRAQVEILTDDATISPSLSASQITNSPIKPSLRMTDRLRLWTSVERQSWDVWTRTSALTLRRNAKRSVPEGCQTRCSYNYILAFLEHSICRRETDISDVRKQNSTSGHTVSIARQPREAVGCQISGFSLQMLCWLKPPPSCERRCTLTLDMALQSPFCTPKCASLDT